MSKIYDRYYNKYKFHIEQFNSAAEVADVSSTRQMTSSSFIKEVMTNGNSKN